MSTQYTASWCFFHALCKYCARRGTFKSITLGSLCLLSIGSIGRKRTLSLCFSNFDLQISIPNWWQNSNWLHIRHDICTGRSCSELQHCPVVKDLLFASCMSFQSSEFFICSWNISAILISPFRSSSCCQAWFPTIVRPLRNLWKLNLKMFFNSPELNRSVIFSLYFLRMSKKMDYFLRNLVRRERRISWFNINPLSFIHRNDAWWINKFSSSKFCFCLWSSCKILHLQL